MDSVWFSKGEAASDGLHATVFAAIHKFDVVQVSTDIASGNNVAHYELVRLKGRGNLVG